MSDAEHEQPAEPSDEGSGGLGFDDIVIERDDEGARKPKEVYVEELDDTMVSIPMNNADKEKYLGPLSETAQVAKAIADGEIDPEELDDDEREELEEIGLSDALVAEMLDELVIDPPLVEYYNRALPEGETRENLDAEFLDEHLYPGADDALFYGVLLASGMDDLVNAFRTAFDPDEDADADAGNA